MENSKDAVTAIAREDFDRASQFFADTGIGKQHKEVAFRFTRKIASEKSIDDALAYIGELENPTAKIWATRGTVQVWMDTDTDAAVGYVNTLSDPAAKDHGTLGVIDAVWRTNPDDSLLWASTIKDNELRSTTYANLASAWQRAGQTENVALVIRNNKLSEAELKAVRIALAPIIDSQ